MTECVATDLGAALVIAPGIVSGTGWRPGDVVPLGDLPKVCVDELLRWCQAGELLRDLDACIAGSDVIESGVAEGAPVRSRNRPYSP